MNDDRTHGDSSAVDDGGDGEGTVVLTLPPPCPVPLEVYAPALLGEECAETAQMAFKGARFGFDHARFDGMTATAGMSMEAGDVLAAIAFNLRAGTLDADTTLRRAGEKFRRLASPLSRDDAGNRLAPEIPLDPVSIRERLAVWPAGSLGATLNSSYVSAMLTDALALIEHQRATLTKAGEQFRFYEREHRAKGDAAMQTMEVESMRKAGASASYAKADRNADFALMCEEAANG